MKVGDCIVLLKDVMATMGHYPERKGSKGRVVSVCPGDNSTCADYVTVRLNSGVVVLTTTDAVALTGER
jgi:hypothetical protein